MLLVGIGSEKAYGTTCQDSLPVKVTALRRSAIRQTGQVFDFIRYKWDASVDASFILPAFYNLTTVSTFGPPINSPFINTAGNLYYGYITGTSQFNAADGRSARFLLRKNENTYNHSNVLLRQGAYRLSLYLNGGSELAHIDTVYFAGTNGILVNKSSAAFNIGINAGYEWQHQLGRFQGYYGYETGVSFTRYRQTVLVVNSATPHTSDPIDIVDTGFSGHASALAGIKFFLHSRFSLGLESTYTINGYVRSYDGVLPADFSKQRFQASGFAFRLTPIAALNATFHFGTL